MDSNAKYKLGRKYWYNKIKIYNFDVLAGSYYENNVCTVAKDMNATPSNPEASDIDVLIMPVGEDVMIRFNGNGGSEMELMKGESLSFEGIMVKTIEFKGMGSTCKIRMIVASYVTRRTIRMRAYSQ